MKTASHVTAPAGDSTAPTAVKSGGKRLVKSSVKQVEASGKLGKVVALLRRPKGATLAEVMRATGWQAHSARGAISGSIKKKLKLTVLSEKRDDVRTYRIKA